MRSWLTTILVTLPLALPGCRTSGTVTPIVGGASGSDGRADQPLVVDPPSNSLYVGPAHVFTPRAHPSHARPMAPPPPDLRTLPRLVNRIDQCSGRSKPAKSRRPITTNQKSNKNKHKNKYKKKRRAPKYKHVPYGSQPVGTVTHTSVGKGSGGLMGGSSDSGGGYGRGAGPQAGGSSGAGGAPVIQPAPVPAESQSLDAAVTSSSSKRAERRDKREQRRTKKKQQKAMEAKPSAPQAAPGMAEPSEPSQDSAYWADEEFERDSPDVATQIARGDDHDADYQDWGQATYLSNDDTMSLSSAQRILYAIDRYLPLPPQHIRPHELLNYFSFNTMPVAETDDFSIVAQIAENPDKEGIYDLAFAVKGRPMDRNSRRNGALTLVIDRSGSMADEGRMNYLKQGLRRMVSELKPGDIVNMVTFDHRVCSPLENFVVGRDRPQILEKAIERLQPRGSTDLYSGLSQGYQLADRSYQLTYSNRVMLVTDALANTGVTDSRAISMVGKYYDERRIRLSGVGVGSDFNDELLDRLTERGKGAYVFLGSQAEVDAVFGPRFVSLMETTALDVHFQLHLPPSLRMNVFYGEEASAVKEDVQAIHYFANTSQLFFSEVMARGGKLRPEDWIMMTIEYENPETGAEAVEEFAWNLGEIQGASANIHKARLLMDFSQRLGELAYRPVPSGFRSLEGGWNDHGAWQICEDGRRTLGEKAAPIGGDPEVSRIRSLWTKMCSRYLPPPQPVQARPVQAQPDSWPSAKG